MASSSTQIITKKYDVFVSFHGDIRLNFRDHLFGALQRKGVSIFRDETMIKKGKSLEPELVRAIEGSLVYVVVFSKYFAYSTWCLRELEMILKCAQVPGKHVFTVFYDVDPSEVRRQNVGTYAEAFAKHEDRFKQKLDMVQNWRDALTQAANISGWDMRRKPQYEETEKLVKEILNALDPKFPSLPKGVVGIHSRIRELENHLLLDLVDDVRVVGISGLGGIGKSTLATILCGRISHQFDTCVFIDDVSKIYRHDGPIGVLRQILRQIMREEPLGIYNPFAATSLIQRRLCRVRSLIIIDNVDQGGQLEKLAVDREWLGAGSRVIIVTRDEHILNEYGVDFIYKVPLLNYDDSLKLFCQKAFKGDYIMSNIMSDYECLANSILHYAKGLPLAIKVLGSFLCGRDVSEWKSALARLRKSPNNDIMDVLRISFDGLEEVEKEIFLDIACFFVGWDEKYVKHVLDCCGFDPDIGLRVLIDKSLVTIAFKKVRMHGLLQELGKQIVQVNSKKNPRKWSRVWKHKSLDNVVQENMEKNVEAVVLNLGGLPNIKGDIWIGEISSKMSHLRLLILQNVDYLGNLDRLSNELRYVELWNYPFKYLPSSFHPNQLVGLNFSYSKLKQLWKGKKYLPNLRFLDLSNSKNLITMPSFSEFPNIERLDLAGCEKLEHLGPSNDVPRKLVYLGLRDCKNLKSIPREIFGLSSLRELNIFGCSTVVKNSNLFSPSESIIMLPFHSMCELDVSFCNIREVPEAIGCLHLLQRLNLEGNKFVTLPSLEKLSKLEYLNLEHCKCLKSLTMLPSPTTIPYDPYRDRESLYGEIINYKLGMFILNCPRLGDRERCSNMTFSWMRQFIRANQHLQCVETIIPGSEIPKWFKNQSLDGSRLFVDRPPIMVDNGVIGFAYCAIFSVAPINIHWEFLELASTIVKGKDSMDYCRIHAHLFRNSDVITVKTTHMWVIYFPIDSLFGIKTRCHLNTRLYSGKGSNGEEVMKQGYNWVFEKDLQI